MPVEGAAIRPVEAAAVHAPAAKHVSIDKAGKEGWFDDLRDGVANVGRQALVKFDRLASVANNTVFKEVSNQTGKVGTAIKEKALCSFRDDKGNIQWKKVALCVAGILAIIAAYGCLNNYAISGAFSGPAASLMVGVLNSVVFIGGAALYLTYKHKRIEALKAELTELEKDPVKNKEKIEQVQAKIKREKREALVVAVVAAALIVTSFLAIPGIVSARAIALVGSWSFTIAMAVAAYEVYKRVKG